MADRDLKGRTLGQHILRELIGAVGYGAMYRGEQPALERDVVVEVLHERRSDSDSRERLSTRRGSRRSSITPARRTSTASGPRTRVG